MFFGGVVANPHNPQNLPVCPHCNRRASSPNHNGRCTFIGCGKPFSGPVDIRSRQVVRQIPLMFHNSWESPHQRYFKFTDSHETPQQMKETVRYRVPRKTHVHPDLG